MELQKSGTEEVQYIYVCLTTLEPESPITNKGKHKYTISKKNCCSFYWRLWGSSKKSNILHIIGAVADLITWHVWRTSVVRKTTTCKKQQHFLEFRSRWSLWFESEVLLLLSYYVEVVNIPSRSVPAASVVGTTGFLKEVLRYYLGT